jgi:hypothetical protein
VEKERRVLFGGNCVVQAEEAPCEGSVETASGAGDQHARPAQSPCAAGTLSSFSSDEDQEATHAALRPAPAQHAPSIAQRLGRRSSWFGE